MPAFIVAIARDRSEYAHVRVEAATAEAAEAHVERVFVENHQGEDAYCALVNGVTWEAGGDADGERILDVTEA